MIEDVLSELETERNIRIILAVENGSRNWNLNAEDSDYDIRFIYHYPLREYLRLNRPKDNIRQKAINEDGVPLDFVGHDIYKFLALLKNSNPMIIEWLRSSIVYYQGIDSELLSVTRDLAINGFNPKALFMHYRSMGWGNFQKYIVRGRNVTYKRYLYAFRGLFNGIFVYKYGILPEDDFETVIRRSSFIDIELKKIYLDEIIPAKREARDKVEIDRMTVVDEWLDHLFTKYHKKLEVPVRRMVFPDNIDDLIFNEISMK